MLRVKSSCGKTFYSTRRRRLTRSSPPRCRAIKRAEQWPIFHRRFFIVVFPREFITVHTREYFLGTRVSVLVIFHLSRPPSSRFRYISRCLWSIVSLIYIVCLIESRTDKRDACPVVNVPSFRTLFKAVHLRLGEPTTATVTRFPRTFSTFAFIRNILSISRSCRQNSGRLPSNVANVSLRYSCVSKNENRSEIRVPQRSYRARAAYACIKTNNNRNNVLLLYK